MAQPGVIAQRPIVVIAGDEWQAVQA